MRRRLSTLIVAGALASMMLVPTVTSAAIESGSSSKWPWSGYWWPRFESGYNLYSNNGPLQKYDQYMQQTTGANAGAQAWERANRSTTDPAGKWWGYCHAWAAASILTPEPAATTKAGVNFSVNDVKGLVTTLYFEPTYQWLSGTRVDDANDTTSAAFQDIAPAWMDYLLQLYPGYYNQSFIMDINADSQVWNYPVFAFRRTSTKYANGVESVTATVWYGNPKWNATGTEYFAKTYTYNLKAGSLGQWTGASVKDHPDFAWRPTGKRAGGGGTGSANPYVKEGAVETITGLNL